ncbi:hypothetical protein RND71_012052 [Anisodus tanguticus]|uniref:Uncharacterized protein n=1 Tax=Anisodus tanguticus TaxID=243964 RepID=A0AAE1VQE1_9SOLA|nr:hypothetical protein RND71_012052 [Anisodus tanguticus]
MVVLRKNSINADDLDPKVAIKHTLEIHFLDNISQLVVIKESEISPGPRLT